MEKKESIQEKENNRTRMKKADDNDQHCFKSFEDQAIKIKDWKVRKEKRVPQVCPENFTKIIKKRVPQECPGNFTKIEKYAFLIFLMYYIIKSYSIEFTSAAVKTRFNF